MDKEIQKKNFLQQRKNEIRNELEAAFSKEK